jgi:hypothetical protein
MTTYLAVCVEVLCTKAVQKFSDGARILPFKSRDCRVMMGVVKSTFWILLLSSIQS